MILISVPPTKRMILSACTESIILSAGGAKQQSTKSCSRKCGKDGSSRGNSGGGNGFDLGSGNNNCSDDSNGNGDGDGDSGTVTVATMTATVTVAVATATAAENTTIN
jgi:hypothetical protein